MLVVAWLFSGFSTKIVLHANDFLGNEGTAL